MTKLELKQKELIDLLSDLLRIHGYNDLYGNDTKSGDLKSEIAELEKQVEKPEKKPKRKSRYIPTVKICAGCGSFAHGNPGHDIT